MNSITWKCRHLCLLIFINLHYRGIHAQIKNKQLSIWIWVVGWFPLKCTSDGILRRLAGSRPAGTFFWGFYAGLTPEAGWRRLKKCLFKGATLVRLRRAQLHHSSRLSSIMVVRWKSSKGSKEEREGATADNGIFHNLAFSLAIGK